MAEIEKYFPEQISKLVPELIKKSSEIRMRINEPLSVIIENKIFYVSKNAEISSYKSDKLFVDKKIIEETFERIFRYSLHSFEREISEGFITLDGGHRVGFCGTAVYKNGRVSTVKNVSSLNFRIAREYIGISDEIYNKIFSVGTKNVIIVGAPLTGKTTILRDLCRKLGENFKVALIDERGEIASVSDGIPQNKIGENTDVFNGYDKKFGIETAIRVMSPQIILCDEACGETDIKSFENAMKSGVKIVATIHGESLLDVENKLDTKVFDYAVLLEKTYKNAKVMKINV